MRKGWLVGVLALALLGSTGESRGEVRTKLAPNGTYLGVEVFLTYTNGQLLVWTPRRTATGPGDRLNQWGDVYGDSFPDIGERPAVPRYPAVAWSRSFGGQRDLVWTEWRPGGWFDVTKVTDDPGDHGDDLNPDIRINAQNRLHLVWWRETDGVGSVMFSVRVPDGWTYPYQISDDGIDSRHPHMTTFTSQGGVHVTYSTPEGQRTQLVQLSAYPTSITDDLDPLITVTTIP